MDHMIDIEGLTVAYGAVTVLEDVTFSVSRGEYLAIVGPNGSGKTTLIKAMLGLLPIDGGRVQMLGQDRTNFNDWASVGYLPQASKALHAGFPATVREVIGMGLLAG